MAHHPTPPPTPTPSAPAAAPDSRTSRTFAGRRFGVVGLGDSGLAMARWLLAQGAEVRVCDSRAEPPGLQVLQGMSAPPSFVAGPFAERAGAWLDGLDALAWSPGLSPTHGPAAVLAEAARARAIPLIGEIELFCQAIAAQAEPARILAITGTNGKTTTACLLAHLLRAAGVAVALAGNVGPAALAELMAVRERGETPAIWVLELSSFQLEFCPSLGAHAAAILNLSQDHLDWHGSMDAYAGAKQKIYAGAQVCVWNRDDPATLPSAAAVAPVRISFGVDAPSRDGDFGLVNDGGLCWLAQALALEGGGRRSAARPTALRVNLLMPAEALRIRGRHNQVNALAALALARAAGAPMAPLLHALRDYPGEAHRCELVAVVDGVEFIDDSKGTNVGATVAALEGLGQPQGARLHLIVGGDGKGQTFESLREPVARHARSVCLIGRDAPRVRAELADTGVELVDCASLEQAVHRAATRARAGDSILLSPACASFDMFQNYRHRSEVFVAAVHALAAERGQPC